MKALPKEKTLLGLTEKKIDKLDDIHRALLNIDQRQKTDWKQFKQQKRRQLFIAMAMAFIGGASLYFELIKVSDMDIFKNRFNAINANEDVKTEIKLKENELLAMERNK